ncbi:MAG: phage tail protein [Dehalococcoidia bacterium]
MSIGNGDNPELRSSYLDHLPGIYRDSEFMGRFLLIFESILGPIQDTVDSLDFYFDPLTTSDAVLPWLASWMDLTLDQTWPERRRRELVRSAAELYRWRGTKRGLREYLRIYTGVTPEITEHIPGMRLDKETRLGFNTRLGSSGGGYHFTVTLHLDGDSGVDIQKVRAIIEAQKPAHTVYTLQIRGQNAETEENDGA